MRQNFIFHAIVGGVVFLVAAIARSVVTREVGNYENLASALHMAKIVFLYLPIPIAFVISVIKKNVDSISKNEERKNFFLVVQGIPYWMIFAFFTFFLLFPVRG